MAAADNVTKYASSSAMDLTHHFSRTSKKRVANVMKEYYRFSSLPGMGSLAGGLPYYGYFPITHLDVTATASHSPSQLNNNSQNAVGKSISLLIKQIQDEPDMFRKIDLATALQYGTAQGFPPLYAWIREWTNSVLHTGIPYKGKADVVICGGSADGLSKVYDLLFNEWDASVNRVEDREGLLVEEMVYTPPVAQIRHKDVNVVPVRMDAEGLTVDGEHGLLNVLENWNYADGKRPHALYLIPTGQNPTSGVLSVTRRKRIYEICSRFDIMIIEDDPYWNLQYKTPTIPSAETGYDFLDHLVPSFLSLDVDGRVIRLDTFSKTIAPGCRLGWITAQPRICEQLIRLTDATSQQPSGISQAVVAQLLRNDWGVDGWVSWLEKLRDNYRQRMVTMATIFQQGRQIQTPDGKVDMFSFNWPTGGMFLWLRVNVEWHPLGRRVNTERLMQALWVLCTQEPFRVLTNPGKDFAANDAIRKERAHLYLRFCFATVEEGVLVSKSHAFVEACRQFWTLMEVGDVDRILVDEDRRTKADEVERLNV